jgi:hypothetical protein
MSCTLTIIGEHLDIDALVEKTKVKGFDVAYKGQPINKVNSRKRTNSSASILTSEAGFGDIESQIKDTIEFLNTYKKGLMHLTKTPEIDYAVLTFGVDSTLTGDNLVQSFYFTKELIKICSRLNIEIQLFAYKKDMEIILAERHQKNSESSANN